MWSSIGLYSGSRRSSDFSSRLLAQPLLMLRVPTDRNLHSSTHHLCMFPMNLVCSMPTSQCFICLLYLLFLPVLQCVLNTYCLSPDCFCYWYTLALWFQNMLRVGHAVLCCPSLLPSFVILSTPLVCGPPYRYLGSLSFMSCCRSLLVCS